MTHRHRREQPTSSTPLKEYVVAEPAAEPMRLGLYLHCQKGLPCILMDPHPRHVHEGRGLAATMRLTSALPYCTLMNLLGPWPRSWYYGDHESRGLGHGEPVCHEVVLSFERGVVAAGAVPLSRGRRLEFNVAVGQLGLAAAVQWTLHHGLIAGPPKRRAFGLDYIIPRRGGRRLLYLLKTLIDGHAIVTLW